jgi:hypothetical protein
MFEAQGGAHDVHIQHAAQGVGVQVDQEGGFFDAGVVDQDVKAAELAQHGVGSDQPLGLVRHIELNERHLAPGRPQFTRDLPTFVHPHIADHHRGPGLYHRPGHGGAQAARSARDQCRSSLEVECRHELLLCVWCGAPEVRLKSATLSIGKSFSVPSLSDLTPPRVGWNMPLLAPGSDIQPNSSFRSAVPRSPTSEK